MKGIGGSFRCDSRPMTSVHLSDEFLVSVVILDQLTSVHLSDEFLGLFEGIGGSVRCDSRPIDLCPLIR